MLSRTAALASSVVLIMGSACSDGTASGDGDASGAAGASEDGTTMPGTTATEGDGQAGDGSTDADATSTADATDASDSASDSSTTAGGDDSSTGGDPGLRCGVDLDCTGDTIWSRRIGNDDDVSSVEGVSAIAVHPQGGAVIGGWVWGSAAFDDAGTIEGPITGFVARLADDGTVSWVHPITATDGISIDDVAVDGQGGVVAFGSVLGDLQSDAEVLDGNPYEWNAFVIGLDGAGGPRFVDRFDSAWTHPSQIAIGPNDEFALVGWFEGSTSFGGPQLSSTSQSADPFVAVFEHDGTHRWSRRFGDDEDQWGEGAAFDAAGDLVVTVHNYGAIDFGDGAVHDAPGLVGLAFAKLRGDDGEPVWSRQVDVPTGINLAGARVASDGERFWLATFNGGSVSSEIDFGSGPVTGHFFVAGLAADGTALWARGLSDDAFGGGGCRAVAASGDDSVVVAGFIQKPTDFGDGTVHVPKSFDSFVVKYDAQTGAPQWARVEGDDDQQTHSQTASGVDVSADGRVWVGGDFGGIMDWGDGDLIASNGFGGSDGFVAVLQP